MKKNKEVRSGCLRRSPACDMAQMQPIACLRKGKTAYLQVAGGKKVILVFSYWALEMIAELNDSISSSEEKTLRKKRFHRARNSSWSFLIV